MTITQANNFMNLGFRPCIAEEGFKLVNTNNTNFIKIDEDTFMYYSKQLNDKEKVFVVADTQSIFYLINEGWRLQDDGLYKDGLSIKIEMGVK